MTSLQGCRAAVIAISLLIPAGEFGLAEKQQKSVRAKKLKFTARAYAIEGTTASGEETQAGRTIAADPEILPLGTRIFVSGAGRYSGEYVVTDTGQLVKGRRLDIYMTSYREAKRFGVRPVTVQIISRGEPPN
jgi:3D (Asp-Asp-Asp) domain-containing protein